MPSLTEIEGIGPSLAAVCVKNNYRTIAKIAAAKPDELSALPGISEKRAAQIIGSAKSLLPSPRIPTTAAKNRQRAVGPVKIGTKAVAVQAPKKSLDEEEKMSKKEVKANIKKLKKKIKDLKAKKKKVLAKESKNSKKKKSSKKK
tara:strand:- start:66342 stop:66776 length:435 start_codon:yes stop_codon:yes gene_type:complete